MITHGTLLAGRVTYHQPEHGYRTALEPVLLAAAVPARAGERVVEGGTGAGAALLCLAARIPGIAGTGIERDPALAGLAAANFAANGFADLEAVAADVASWRAASPFHHAIANPPWHDAAGTRPAEPGRDAAKARHPGLRAAWIAALAVALRPRGTLTLILPAGQFAAAAAEMRAAGCGAVALLPLWPGRGKPARIVILQARRLARGADAVLPGLTLHGEGGEFTAEAARVLRDGAALAMEA